MTGLRMEIPHKGNATPNRPRRVAAEVHICALRSPMWEAETFSLNAILPFVARRMFPSTLFGLKCLYRRLASLDCPAGKCGWYGVVAFAVLLALAACAGGTTNAGIYTMPTEEPRRPDPAFARQAVSIR